MKKLVNGQLLDMTAEEISAKKAEENCIKYGRKIEDFSLEEWKKLVAEEEEELIKSAWRFGGVGAIAFGFMPWW